MPFAPLPLSLAQRTPSHSAGDPLDVGPGADTPCKIPRPLKRRRFVGLLASREEEEAAEVLPSEVAEVKSWVGLELALAVSFALLETGDIVHAAASCTVWRGVAECKTLWALAAPRLGLASRIVQRQELSRRRSRGVVLRGVLLGERRCVVALRTVDLRGANAGLDDGLLPTVVREVSLLRSLGRAGHPGIVRLVGAEVVGEQVHIVTEYAASSFLQWFSRPRSPQLRLRAEIRDRFWQLLRAVAFLHARGVFHRNITPPNVLLDLPAGTVKLCDLACGRALDTPPRPYSPEDPKLRPQSTREARRLWYRAPELILRQPVYGPPVDVWSVGALMAEAAKGEPLFPSESEVDHLFRVFRFAGTPGPDRWPQAMAFPAFSARFPLYEPVDLRLAARAAARGGGGGADGLELRRALGERRPEVLSASLRCGAVLGINGVELLGSLLRLDPQARCTAEGALTCAFLKRLQQQLPGGPSSAPGAATVVGTPPDAVAPRGDEGHRPSRTSAQSAELGLRSPAAREDLEAGTPRTQVARGVASLRLSSPLPRARPLGSGSPRVDAAPGATWEAMASLDASLRAEADVGRALPGCGVAAAMDPAETEVASESRATLVDLLLGLAGDVQVGDFGVHLAVALFDEERLAAARGVGGGVEPDLAAVVCLKMADAFDEHSQEYYQRERTSVYYHAMRHRWPLAALLEAEKRVAQAIGFRVHRPTAMWFLRACAHAGGAELLTAPGVVRMARFIAELCLLDAELQRQPAALRAQVALLIALHTAASAEAADRLWRPVQRATCGRNSKELAALCLSRTTHVLRTKRQQWAAKGLHAVERRHAQAARLLPPSCGLPAGLLGALLPVES